MLKIKLKNKGLKVLKEPYPPNNNTPTLHIVYSLMAYGEDQENLLYSVSVELSQEAIMLRDKEIQTYVVTWQQGFFGTGTAFNLNPLNREMLNYLDFFIED